MSYKDEYSESVEIPLDALTDAHRIVIEGLVREGEFRARDLLIAMLEADVDDYVREVDYEPNVDWINGMRYAIHVIREAKLDGKQG